MVTVWSQLAKKQLKEAYIFIKQTSPQNAEKIKDEIIDLSITLATNPEIYPLYKYKLNNDGTYRAFELYHYRISFRVLKDVIRIVRMRHTSRSPLNY